MFNISRLSSINNLYLLLYLPLAGLLLLCLRGGWKFMKERRLHSRETWLRTGGASLAVMLFTASYAVLISTHGHGYRTAMLLIMAMALVNALRTASLLRSAKVSPDE